MQKLSYVHAEWDDVALVWVASSDDIPGLVTEAATTEELIAKLKVMIPELMAINGDQVSMSPMPFELLTRRFELTA
jgi:predicted RNase H-like HicB family nuclease